MYKHCRILNKNTNETFYGLIDTELEGLPEYELVEISEDFTVPDTRTYIEKRLSEYPSVGDVVDAICKKLDGNDTDYLRIQAERLTVKQKYPKE